MLVKYILLLALLLSLGNAKDGTFSGYIYVEQIIGDEELNNGFKLENKTFNKLDTVLNYDKEFDRAKISVSQGYFKTSKMYNSTHSAIMNPIEVYYINELSLTYLLVDNLTVTVGALPFKNGTFSEYSFANDKNGNGLLLADSQILEGAFLSYKRGDLITSLGYVEKNMFFENEYNLIEPGESIFNKNLSKDKKDYYDYTKSGGVFLISKYEKGKHRLELNLFNANIVLDKKKLGTMDLEGIGYSYDDTEYSGNLFYGVFMYSHLNGDSSVFNNGVTVSTPDVYFGKVKSQGSQFLLGYKYTFDLDFMKKEMSFDTEYARTNNGYVSFNMGTPFSGYGYGAVGDTYNSVITLMYDKNLQFKLRYYLHNSNGYKIKYGGITKTTKLGPKDIKSFSGTALEVIYKF